MLWEISFVANATAKEDITSLNHDSFVFQTQFFNQGKPFYRKLLIKIILFSLQWLFQIW
jgi:hypothetical protein